MKKRMIGFFVVAMVFSMSILSAATLADGQKLLERIDAMSNFEGTDFSALMTMISEDPTAGIERTKVLQFRSDDDDKFLLLIQEPAVKKGQGYLLVDESLWFYDPQSRKFSHTSLNDQFNRSDANNSDFNASSLAEDYQVVSISEEMLGKYKVYRLGIEATNNEVTYPTQNIWVTIDGLLVLKTEDYSASGRLMRTSYYPSYAKAGDKFIPTRMIFQDELVEGKKTTISLSDISVQPIPDSVFTKAYVERINR
jgi:outer membrane lipoprotein-sorting protein